MFFVLLIAGFAGGFAHWFNSWAQGRTDDSFVDYLKVNRKRTIAASISIVMSTIASYLANPDVTMNAILFAVTAGYMIDNVANKGSAPVLEAPPAPTPVVETAPVQESVNEDKNKTLDNLLADDSSL